MIPPKVSVGAIGAIYYAFVLSTGDLEKLRAAPESFQRLRPTPPVR